MRSKCSLNGLILYYRLIDEYLASQVLKVVQNRPINEKIFQELVPNSVIIQVHKPKSKKSVGIQK
jgi:hypothetical protein